MKLIQFGLFDIAFIVTVQRLGIWPEWVKLVLNQLTRRSVAMGIFHRVGQFTMGLLIADQSFWKESSKVGKFGSKAASLHLFSLPVRRTLSPPSLTSCNRREILTKMVSKYLCKRNRQKWKAPSNLNLFQRCHDWKNFWITYHIQTDSLNSSTMLMKQKCEMKKKSSHYLT